MKNIRLNRNVLYDLQMKNIKPFKILSLILFCIFILVLFSYLLIKDSNEKINHIRLENKQLQLKYDSINNLNKSISLDLINSQKKIDSIKNEETRLSIMYEQNKQQIKNNKNKYEKNNRIDNFSSPDIIKYFTDSL
jgi:biopolymer transport protein ExbB/TolQ